MEIGRFRGLTIQSLCRTCLSILTDHQKYDIFKVPDLAKELILCTSLAIEPSDGLSPNICDCCLKKMNELRNFQLMCVDSTRQMQYLIKSNIISNKESIKFETLEDDKKHNLTIFKQEDKYCPISDRKISTHSDAGCKQTDSFIFWQTEKAFPLPTEEANIENKKDLFVVENAVYEKKKNSSEIFACDKCPKKFYKEHRYNAHKQTHEGLKPYPCSLCEKRFAKPNSLQLHIQYIHGNIGKHFMCTEPNCGRSYRREQTLKWHMRKLHKQGPALPEPKKSICELCGKIFKNFNNLKKHRFIHTGEKLPFGCSLCSKHYITKHKLKEHMMRHLGEKNFICSICGMKKITDHELKIHMNTHTREVSFECRVCLMKFNSVGNLRRHTRIVHEGIKNYKCQYCEKSFGKEETRRHHEMRHTGEKPHKCPICQKRFIQVIAMRTHLKRHKNKEERILEQVCEKALKS